MKKILWLAAVLCCVPGLFAKTAVIYHTSDTHGFFYPKNGQGGAAALAAVLAEEKQPYLLLDSGDFAEGTAETKASRGLKAVWLMNRLGYQAATLGNHEWAFGEDALEHMVAQAEFAVLAANVTDKRTGEFPRQVQAYKVFDVNGVKVAVIGLANAQPNRRVDSYEFQDPLAALGKALESPEVRQAAITAVIVHDSLVDYKNGILPYVGDITKKYGSRVQLVLGGHAHKVIQNEFLNGVLYTESGFNFQYVSKITIETDDETGALAVVRSELIPLIVGQTGQDPAIRTYADTLREPGIDAVLGYNPQVLSNSLVKPNHQDTPLACWIADLGRAYAGTDIYLHNHGGTRAEMPSGPVTWRDLLDIYPFDDSLVKTRLSGAQLEQLVKDTLLPWNRFAYSGMTVSYKLNKQGEIQDLQIRVGGKKLHKNRQYTLATNSYDMNGGDKAAVLKQIPVQHKQVLAGQTVRGLMADALKTGEVKALPSGRAVLR